MLSRKFVVLALSLICGHSMGDPDYYAYVEYVGEKYQMFSVLDQNRSTLYERRLLTGQGFTLPVDLSQKKQQFFVVVDHKELTVRMGCKSKQVKKALGAGLVKFSFNNTPTPCVYKVKDLPKPKEVKQPEEPVKPDVQQIPA